VPGDLGPSTQRRALETNEEKNPSKEAFNAAACARCFFGPGRRETGAILPTSGSPRNDGHGSQNGRNPGNETHTPRGRIQTNDTGRDLRKAHRPGQQSLGNRSIVCVGRGEAGRNHDR